MELTNTAVELDNIEVSNPEQLDMSAIDHPLSDLGGLNIPAQNPVQQSGGDPTKPGSPAPKTIGDIRNLIKLNRAESEKSAANVGKEAIKARNPLLAYGNYEFDQYATNVDRYRGYGASTFNKLGFNPLEDNETYYNKNTNGLQEFRRMSGEFGGLFATGFMSNYNSIGRLFSGEDYLTPATEDSDAYERAIKLGSSSKGGPLGFTNNLALNMAYTVGIATNIAAEEAAIWGLGILASPFTGGGSVAAAGVAQTAENVKIASQVNKLREGLTMAFRGQEIGQMFKGGVQMLGALNKVDNAKDFYTGAKTAGKGLLNFVNPLRRTAEFAKGTYEGTQAYRNLNNAAKLSKGFGSFYRDMRDNWYAVSEAQLEGGGVYNNRVNEEIANYQREYGKDPDAETLRKIYNNADAAGRMTTLANIPLIYVTNRLVFDGLFKFKGIASAMEEASTTSLSKSFKFSAADKAFTEVGKKGMFRTTVDAFKNPKAYAGAFFNYTKANFGEGFQESLQETTSDAMTKYYGGIYKDPALGNSDYLKSSIYAAAGDQIFSQQGFETFLSGFLMGGAIGGGQKLLISPLTKAGELYTQKFKPEKYAEYVTAKNESKTKALNALNQIIANPEAFFSRTKESFINQKRANQNMSEAELNNDDKSFYDAKDEKAFDHIFTALDNGTYKNVLDGFKEMSNLSEEELAQAFNLETGTKAKEKLAEYVSRAKEIKNRYDYFQSKFPNPFKPDAFIKGSEQHVEEFIGYKAFEDAKKIAIASQYGFNRALERMTNVYQDLATEKPVKKASAAEFSVILDPVNIKSEIKILKTEISTLEQGDADQKKLAKQKSKKLDSLSDYLEAYDNHYNNRTKTTLNEQGQVIIPFEEESINPLEKAYKNYVKAIADVTGDFVFEDDITSSFRKVMDYYELNEDSKNYGRIVNSLTNPALLQRYASNINNTLKSLYENRNEVIGDSIDGFMNTAESTALINSLAKMNVIIEPDQLRELINNGVTPTDFFDSVTNKEIEKGSAKDIAVQAALETYFEIKRQSIPSVDTNTVDTPVVSDTEADTQFGNDMLSDLKQLNSDKGTPANTENKVQINVPEPAVPALISPVIQSSLDMLSKAQELLDAQSKRFEKYIPAVQKYLDTKKQQLQDPKLTVEQREKIAKTIEMDMKIPIVSLNNLVLEFAPNGRPEKIYINNPETKESYNFTTYFQENGERNFKNNPNYAFNRDERLGQGSDYGYDIVTKNSIIPIEGLNLREAETLRHFLSGADSGATQYAAHDTDNLGQGLLMGVIKHYFIEKAAGRMQRDYWDYLQDPRKEMREQIEAIEGNRITEVSEQSSVKKVQDMLDSITSLKELPDPKFSDGKGITMDLMEMIASLEITADEVKKAVDKKRVELLKNLSINDLQNGDLVTFTDGKKGVIISVGEKNIKVKVFGPKSYKEVIISGDTVSKTFTMVEKGKISPSQEINEELIITEEDKVEVEASKDNLDSYRENAANVKKAGEDAAKLAGKDNAANLNNLLNNIGCKTK